MEGSRLKILLIEDDKIDQKSFEWLVREEKLPYDYKIVDSISKARNLLSSERFDAIISDLLLTDGTCFEILESFKDTPIIIVTGAGNEETAVKAIKAGAYDYLVKGIDRHHLKMLPLTVENALKYKKLEAILDEKQKSLLAIFDAVPICMLLVDKNMVVKRVNDAVRQKVLRDYVQIINRPFGEALCCKNSTCNDKGCGFSPACKGCLLRKSITSALDSGQSVRKVEFQPVLIVDGKEFMPWFSASVEPVIIDGSKDVVIAIDDITDQKISEEKLKETMEIKSQFISTVSHELRTPLGCMKEAISIVLDGIVGRINEQQKKFLGMAKRNVDRLAVLVNEVLDFQRLEASRIRLDIQENDIAQVVEEAYQTMSALAKKAEIDFSLELEGNLPKAMFDSAQIIQVLTNLVSNAIKFTSNKGRVTVSVRRQDEELVIKVSDTGMGIPKEALPKIFDSFYRVHRPGVEIPGTGLGLAIVRKIVVLHGGRIEVESEVNKGSTFIVYLPLSGRPKPEVLPQPDDEALEEALVFEHVAHERQDK
jgi:signal transduction histidine kinase/ActR/RegA family two-component response regulator